MTLAQGISDDAAPACPYCGRLLQHVSITFPNVNNHPGWRCPIHGAQVPIWRGDTK